jgi:hypothetical protein
MTMAVSATQLLSDNTFVADVGEEPTATTLDTTTGEWAAFQVQTPVCVRLPNVRFSTSAAFVRTLVRGLLATCHEDPSGRYVTILASSARADCLSDQVALNRTDVPLWLDAEMEAVFDEAQSAPRPAANWIQLATGLFPHSRKMTSAERAEFDAIAQQWQRPLRLSPRKLPPTP